MHDQILIKSLRVPTTIGTLKHERAITQTLVLDIAFSLDASIAAMEDDIQQTVNYDTLTRYVIEYGTNSEHLLIETFAHNLAKDLIKHFQLQDIKLTVKKPHAIYEAEFVAITVERSLED